MPKSRGQKWPRIVVVSDTYPPVVGGAEMDVQRVSSELIRRGYQVEVLCAGGEPMPKMARWLDPAGVPVRILTRRPCGVLSAVQFAFAVAFRLLVQTRRYDLVYFSMQGLHLAAGLPIAHLLGKRIIMKVHGSTVIPLIAQSHIGQLELRWLRKWASAVMLLNDEMRQEALDHGLREEQLLHMPNPVDTERFSPVSGSERAALRAALDMPVTGKVLIYVGRLSHEKGLEFLLDGFARAALSDSSLYLYLLGDGAIRRELERRVADFGVIQRQFRFVGAVSSSEVPSWLRAADAFALVSPNEGFSCALSEAMAVGLASVVSRIPANVQLVQDGKQGYTVPFGDDSALSNAILKLLSDPELTRRMGAAAREEIVKKYSIEKVIDQYEALFQRLVGKDSGTEHSYLSC